MKRQRVLRDEDGDGGADGGRQGWRRRRCRGTPSVQPHENAIAEADAEVEDESDSEDACAVLSRVSSLSSGSHAAQEQRGEGSERAAGHPAAVTQQSPGQAQPSDVSPSEYGADFSDEDWFEGFRVGADEDGGMDRFAEVIVFLESGDFLDSDGEGGGGTGRGGGGASSAALREDSLSLSDDGELPDDPHEREVIGSLPEPTMSLHAAALRGDTKELRRWQLWKGGGKGRASRQHRGDLPLHCAARAGDVSTVEQLLNEGANVWQTNHREHTALEIAARNGHAAVVKTLLEYGAGDDPDEMDRAFCATKSWAVVQALTENDPMDIRSNDSSVESGHQSPWLYQMLFRVVQKGRVTMLRGLLRMGANANSTGILGWTPLQIASRRGHIRCVSELLQHGADVAGRDDFKWTALHYAAREGHYDIVKMLLHAGADVTAMCRTGRTPLEVAHDDATRRLLDGHRQGGSPHSSGAEDDR